MNPEQIADYALLAKADAEMLRRAARACRNMQNQAVGPREWFDWVPKHLDHLAEQIDGSEGG